MTINDYLMIISDSLSYALSGLKTLSASLWDDH